MKKNKLNIILLMLVVIFSTYCATPMGMATSSVPLKHKFIAKNLGKATASNLTLGYIGLPGIFGFTVNAPSIQDAIDKAVTMKNGDALVNIRWYQSNTYLLLFTLTRVTVMGDVVKLESDGPKEKNEK